MEERELIYHPLVARDAREIAEKYAKVSEGVLERFWAEFDEGIEIIKEHPERQHYDPCGLRRYNLKRFPYHILFEERLECLRVIVVRHHHRNPRYGLRRK